MNISTIMNSNILFYIASVIALFSTIKVITKQNAMHALLYLVVSFFAAAAIFFTFGAPLMAALEIIIYAGAIMVLFIFVVMLLNLAPNESHEFNAWKSVSTFGVPLVLILILIAEMVYILATGAKPIVADSAVAPLVATITPKAVAIRLYSSYSLGVELSSLLLLAAMVGAYHIGKKRK